jgi:hypothetical protein
MAPPDGRHARNHDAEIAAVADGPEMKAAARAFVDAAVKRRKRTKRGPRGRVAAAITEGMQATMATVLTQIVAFRRGVPAVSEEDAALIRYLCNPPLNSLVTATETSVAHAMEAAWKTVRDTPPRAQLMLNDRRLAAVQRGLQRGELNDLPDWDRDIEVVHHHFQQRIARALQRADDPKIRRRLQDPEAASTATWTQMLTTTPPIGVPPRTDARPATAADGAPPPLHGPADGRCWFFTKTGARCTGRAGRFWCATHCAGATVNPAFVTARGDVKEAKDCPGDCPVYASGPNAGKPRAGVSKGFHFCSACRDAQHARYAEYAQPQPQPQQPRRRRRQSSITEYAEYVTTPRAKRTRREGPAASSSTTGPAAKP